MNTRTLRARRWSLLGGLLGAILAVALTSGPASAATIKWQDFVGPSGEGPTYAPGTYDRIKLTMADNVAPSGHMRIVFNSEVTWRKGIELDRRTYGCGWLGCSYGWEFFAGLYTQDADKGGYYRDIPLGYVSNRYGYGRLRFGKAGFGGVWHGDAYVLNWDNAHYVDRRAYYFTWLAD